MRTLFSPLATPAGAPYFLFDMACHTTDSTHYSRTSPDTLDNDVWYALYDEMRNSAYDTTIMERPDTVFHRALWRQKDTVMMNVLHYDYYEFLDDALTTNTYFDFDTVNDKLTDKAIRPGYPFQTKTIFAVAPAVYNLPYRKFTFRVDPAHYFVDEWNDDGDPWFLNIDFGDGSGWLASRIIRRWRM